MTNISRIQNLKFDDPFHSKQIGWQCALTNTSRSDRSFNIGDIEDKIIILLSKKLLSIMVLEVVCIHFSKLTVCDWLHIVKSDVSLFKKLNNKCTKYLMLLYLELYYIFPFSIRQRHWTSTSLLRHKTWSEYSLLIRRSIWKHLCRPFYNNIRYPSTA